MKKLIVALAILAASPMFMATSCKKEKPCGDDVICTMVFAQVSVEVLSASQQPVILDDVYTIRVSTGDTIQLDQSMGDGHYTVLDDSYQDELANSSATFRFIGMKNGQKIVDEVYQIGADCCHIDKTSGPDDITIVAVP